MKKHSRILAILFVFALAITSMTAFTATAYAGAPPESENTTQTPTPTPEPAPAPVKPVPLTPDGQMTLVDDISGAAAEDKQFYTVITKGGNYFYLVIDKASNTENVHFLNLVDESDLLALIKDEKQSPTVTTPPEPVAPAPTTPEPEPEPQPKESSLPVVLGIILLLALAGGGAFFYIKVLKPKRTGNAAAVPSELDEFDFDDDDEFDVLDNGDIDIMEPDTQTEPYSYTDYEAKEDEQ